MSKRLKNLGERLDSHFGISANYQYQRWASNKQSDGKLIKRSDGSTNLTKLQWMKEFNNWIKNNPKEWKSISNKHTNRYEVLTAKIVPFIGRMEWDKDGNVVGKGKGLSYVVKNVSKKNNPDYAAAQERGVRKDTRGNRVTKAIKYTEKDFVDWGRRNGYSTKQSKAIFNRFKQRNSAQSSRNLIGLHNDHNQPYDSEFQNPGETYRNKLQIKNNTNLKKSNKLMTKAEMQATKTPMSKAANIAAEFNDVALVSEKVRQNIINNIAKDKNRITSTANNARLNAAKIRRENFMKLNNFGKFNGNGNGNGKNGNGKNGNGKLPLKAITAKTKSTVGLQLEDLFDSKLIPTAFGPYRGV